jgi:hypothetical protein
MSKDIDELVSELNKWDVVRLRGLGALFHGALLVKHLTKALGYEIVVDPNTPPDLLDALGICVPSAAEGAALGVLLGLLIGSAFGEPRAGIVLGGVCGGLAGTARGSRSLRHGLRLVGRLDAAGLPIVTIVRK